MGKKARFLRERKNPPQETSEATDDEKSEAADDDDDDDDETEEPTSAPTSAPTFAPSSSNMTKIFAEVGFWHEEKCAIKSLQNCAQSGCFICECDILGNNVAFCAEAEFAVEVPEACDCSDAVRIKHLLTKNLDSLVQK